MTRLPLCLMALAGLWSAPALAQGLGPRPGPGMGGGGSGQQHKETPQGPAEAAPEEKEGEPEIPPLPAWPGQETRKLQFLQMRGYFRFRWYMHHDLAMGMVAPGAPYSPYNPISEHIVDPKLSMSCAARRLGNDITGSDRGLSDATCRALTLGGADVRLRLEPTINVSEHIRIHTQFDIFDNLVMGSTPRSLAAKETVSDVSAAAFSDGQAAPVAGRNTSVPAILVKRAWAEVDLPITTLRFGRMATHWGMGIFVNDGNCPNCDRGDTQDRIMLTASLSQHTFAFGYDFSSSGPNSTSIAEGTTYYGGQPVDLEKLDDVHQFMWMAGRMDPEEVIQDRTERGELVLNYGIYLLWRKQDFDYKQGLGLGSSTAELASGMLERHAWMLMPDLWFKLLWKKLSLELEGVLVGGSIGNSTLDRNVPAPLNIMQFGWALRSQYRFLKDSLKVGIEVGMASGDDDEPANGEVSREHYHPISTKTRGGWMSEFRFNYDYQIDLILFREILGTVANAVYFKPNISYDIIQTLGARLDIIYSLAHKPVGFPGNSQNLGLELDLEVYYRNVEEGFYGSLAYGIMFPFGALDRPAEIYGTGLDSSIAHTLQGRLFIKF